MVQVRASDGSGGEGEGQVYLVPEEVQKDLPPVSVLSLFYLFYFILFYRICSHHVFLLVNPLMFNFPPATRLLSNERLPFADIHRSPIRQRPLLLGNHHPRALPLLLLFFRPPRFTPPRPTPHLPLNTFHLLLLLLPRLRPHLPPAHDTCRQIRFARRTGCHARAVWGVRAGWGWRRRGGGGRGCRSRCGRGRADVVLERD